MKIILILMTTLMLTLLSASAQSIPFWIDDVSGNRGDPVALTLNDGNAQDLEAVTLLVTYDFSRLEFLDALVGTLTSDFLLVADKSTPGEVLVSLAFGQPPINGQSGSILTAQFRIRSTASLGETTVTMVCPAPCVDYNIPLTTGRISILERGSPLPEAPTPMLLLLGLMLFGARQRQACWKATDNGKFHSQ